MYTYKHAGAFGGQERLETLELELKTVVNSHVSAGTRTWVLCESNTCLYPVSVIYVKGSYQKTVRFTSTLSEVVGCRKMSPFSLQ